MSEDFGKAFGSIYSKLMVNSTMKWCDLTNPTFASVFLTVISIRFWHLNSLVVLISFLTFHTDHIKWISIFPYCALSLSHVLQSDFFPTPFIWVFQSSSQYSRYFLGYKTFLVDLSKLRIPVLMPFPLYMAIFPKTCAIQKHVSPIMMNMMK